MTTRTRVLKYRLPFLVGTTSIIDIDMPADAALLHVAVQHDEIHLWALADDTRQTRTERFRMYGTGQQVEGSHRYLGTVHHEGFVWHVFHEPPAGGAANV